MRPIASLVSCLLVLALCSLLCSCTANLDTRTTRFSSRLGQININITGFDPNSLWNGTFDWAQLNISDFREIFDGYLDDLHTINLALQDPVQGFQSWFANFSSQLTYELNSQEYQQRYQVWLNNLNLINQTNSVANQSFWLKPNRFADMTSDEFRNSSYFGLKTATYNSSLELLRRRRQLNAVFSSGSTSSDSTVPSSPDYPNSVNWTDAGYVSAVRSQAQCQGCWAYAAVGAVESVNAIFYNTTNPQWLSVAQVINCNPWGANCVTGGTPEIAFMQIIAQGGSVPDSVYPISSSQINGPTIVPCQTVPANTPMVTIDSYSAPFPNGAVCCVGSSINVAYQGNTATKLSTVNNPATGSIPLNNQQALAAAVAVRPVAVAVNATNPVWQLYGGGVVEGSTAYSNCEQGTNHAVLVTGYHVANCPGSATGSGCWYVKNSWGADWGESGYITIAMGYESEGGMCGILSQGGAYPIKNNPNPVAPPPKPSPPRPPPKPPSPPGAASSLSALVPVLSCGLAWLLMKYIMPGVL